ncbi:MAG: DPP IV N-terminal domain-containing protein [Phycisphaeraceae bacterium]|nr:DPP IV N-terminal domain-containing protein [Phycisphaeraceae bacterium]
MASKTTTGFTLLVLIAVALGGCKQYYNGAFGLGGEGYNEVTSYHEKREQRLIDQDRQQARLRAETDGTSTTEPRSSPGRQPANTTEPVIYPEMSDEPEVPTDVLQGAFDRPRPQPYVSTNPQDPTHHNASNPIDIFGDMAGRASRTSPLDSTGQLRRISLTDEGADFDVTIDKAGEQLLYSSTRHRKTSDIYRQRIDGSAITQLTDDEHNDVMPSLSPDGKTIAFASDRSGNWDLYLMDADGGPAVQLTNDRTHDIHPSFSPDGKHLVYSSLSDRTGQWQMVVVDVANPTTKRYIGHGLFPQWSPKGKTILYQRARERGTRWFSVWTIELDDRGEAGSPTEIVWSSDFACITPSWSPDGKAVVFCTVTNPEADTQGDRPAQSDVWIAKANGSGRTKMTRGRFANLQPVWSGDNAIYFVSNRGTNGVENIWALDPDDAIKVAFGVQTDETQTADVPTDSD